MKSHNHLDKVITYLLLTGLTLILIFLYTAQERLFASIGTSPIVLGPSRYLRVFSVIIVTVVVLLSLFRARTQYRFSIYFAYLLLLIYIALNFIISGGDISDMAYVMDTRGIGPWLCFGLIFVSYHDERFALFNRFLVFAVLFIAVLAIYNFIDFGIGLYRGQALSKYQVYAVNYVWTAPYVFLILKHKKKSGFLRAFVLAMGIILALIIQTRSFLLIYMFVLLFDFFNTKRKTSYIVLFIVALGGLIYLILNTEIFSSSLDLLIKRGLHDTRSEQLASFLNQLNPIELITGGGFYASYRFANSQWFAVDNQWFYLLWWAGLVPFLCYLYLAAVIPVKMVIRGGLSYESKVECFILILWVLALTGLAIFTTITIGFYVFIISIILGRLLHKYSKGLK